jgi:CheY-like chemotaxis protein
VFLAEGTPEALAIAQAHALDVVISDHRLREGDSGPQAIRAVKALHPRSVAALVTGDTAPDRIQDAQKAGVPLLHKPLSVDQLVGLLQSVDRQP